MVATKSSEVIVADGLSRRFADLEAVRNVSFTVGAGEVFGLLGPNGAGKSTTINMLCTLLRPTGGRATIAGFDVVGQRSEVRRSIGLVFQEPTLDEYLTADQNLRFHAYAYGVPRSVWEPRSDQLLELMGLSERRDHTVRMFSGGMKRRLEIVRGLLHQPRVLFLDEPTLGLDPQTRHLIWEYILDLREREGLTIFLTTHYMDEAEYCDRLAVIDHGEVVALDTPERLREGVGADLVTIRGRDMARTTEELTKLGFRYQMENGAATFPVPRADEFLPEFLRTFPEPLASVNLRRPTLDDVFLRLTGPAIREEDLKEPVASPRWHR
jgi:ABC-2 type transport system ATP-binding protein